MNRLKKTRFASVDKPFGVALILVGAVALLFNLLVCHLALGQDLPAVGDGQYIWIIRPSADGQHFSVMHRSNSDGPDLIRPALELKGVVNEHGLAAADGELWLTLGDLGVQSIRVQRPTMRDLPWQFKSHFELYRLPGSKVTEHVTLRSMAASRMGPWVLIRVHDPDVLQLIDASDDPSGPADQPREQSESDSPTPYESDGPAEQVLAMESSSGVETDLDVSSSDPLSIEASLPADRLLRLTRNQWVSFALPDDYAESTFTRLIMSTSLASVPYLVALSDQETDEISVFEYLAELSDELSRGQARRWQRHSYAFPYRDNLVVFPVDGQIALARGIPATDGLEVTVWILRPNSDHVIELGRFDVDTPVTEWTVVPSGQNVALITTNDSGKLSWQRMDLRGDPIDSALLKPPPKRALGRESADRIILVAVFVSATLIMFLYWRRDSALSQLELPEHIALADLGSRAVAGLIDLVPGVLIAVIAFPNVEPFEIARSWPGNSGGWSSMLPGVVAIVVLIVHCSISEILTARTLGKAILRLRVTDLKGQPPQFWQVLARNFMKTLDLIAFPLLILPLLAPSRQRLGDLIARTVVVTGRVDLVESDKSEPDARSQRDQRDDSES